MLLGAFDPLFRLLLLLLKLLYLLFQRVDFPAAAEQVGLVAERAAGDRAAGGEELALQRHDAQTVFESSGQRDRVVHRVRHDDAAEQRGRDVFVSGVRLDQRIREADHALFL